MKRTVLNYLVVAALALSAVCTSCGGGGIGGSSGKIKMTTEQGGGFSFHLGGSGVATVDWGDGSEKVTLTLKESEDFPNVFFSHTYPNSTIRTITINGDNITWLLCHDDITSLDVSRCTELTRLKCVGTFTSLDVSKNTALTQLDCSGALTKLDVSKNTELTVLDFQRNKLTSLDVSKNTALTVLVCYYNPLTSSELNALFETLHSNAGEKKIFIGYNPGVADCDRSIAERKGWTVVSY